jgi:RecB family endonuclease NucS
MKTYVYYYKSDSSQEVIGRIIANDLTEAQETLATIKRLNLDAIVNLFEIKQIRNNEDFI